MYLSIANSGFETGDLSGWMIASGSWQIAGQPNSGAYAAQKPGGPHPGFIYQDLDVSAHQAAIDDGRVRATIGLYTTTDRANGGSYTIMRFRKGSNDLQVWERGCTAHVWVWASDWDERDVPPGTDNIRVEFGTCDEATKIDDTSLLLTFLPGS